MKSQLLKSIQVLVIMLSYTVSINNLYCLSWIKERCYIPLVCLEMFEFKFDQSILQQGERNYNIVWNQ